MMNDKFILADPNGKEIRYLEDIREMDIQLKDTGKENNDNTFEFSYDKKFHGECGDYGYRIYIPGTEYGGLMGQMKVDTKENQIIWTGNTWRGMLAKKIIVPAAGQDYRTVSGDLHTIMRQLINPEYGSLIRAPDTSCGVSIESTSLRVTPRCWKGWLPCWRKRNINCRSGIYKHSLRDTQR